MSTSMDGWEPITTEVEVPIPTSDGTAIAEKIKLTVPALRNPKDGEIYLGGEALQMMDDAKARHMGLLLPKQIKELRETLGLTQKQISLLLQIGEKTWTRWETGKDRPSRSLNLLLHSLYDGKVDVSYLKSLAPFQTSTEWEAAWATAGDLVAHYDLNDHAANEELALAA